MGVLENMGQWLKYESFIVYDTIMHNERGYCLIEELMVHHLRQQYVKLDLYWESCSSWRGLDNFKCMHGLYTQKWVLLLLLHKELGVIDILCLCKRNPLGVVNL